MVKISRSTLNELAAVMPVLSECEQRSCIGGTGAFVSGGASSSSFTDDQFKDMYLKDTWQGGSVENFGVLGKDIDVTFYNSGKIDFTTYLWADGRLFVNGYGPDGEFFTGFVSSDSDLEFNGSGLLDGSGMLGDGDPKAIDNSKYQKLLDGMTPEQRALITSMGITINDDPNMAKAGQYNATTKTITIRDATNENMLITELIHAKQQEQGVLEIESSSNFEYQQHVLQDILLKVNGIGNRSFVMPGDSGNYGKWMGDVLGDEVGYFNRDLFYEKVDTFFGSFRSKYSDNKDSSRDPNPNYKWDWETYLNLIGVK